MGILPTTFNREGHGDSARIGMTMDNTKSIFELVREAGIEFSNHESDLYIPVNDKTRAIIEAYKFKNNVNKFTNSIDGKQWYDIRFAYALWWERAWTGDSK